MRGLPTNYRPGAEGPQPSGSLRALLRSGFGRMRFEPVLEEGFNAQRRASTLLLTRLAIVLTGLFMPAFVLFDQFVMGYRYPVPVHNLLLFFCSPITLLGGLLLFNNRIAHHAAAITSSLLVLNTLCWMWCYPQMIYSPAAPPYAFEAMLLFSAMTYTLSGLMFWGAASIAAGNALGFLVVMSFTSLTVGALLYSSLFLFAANAVGFIGAYLREMAARENYLNAQLVNELAERDPLTGLYNRRAFAQRLENLIRQARRESVSLTVLVMDVDNFKDVNDGLGHPFGDKVLVAAATAVLESSRRPLDCVARMGGDEFVAVWFDMAPPHVQSACEGLMAAFAQQFAPLTSKHGLALSMSVGAAHAVPALWHDGETLLKFADSALYQTKANGRNGFTVVGLDERSNTIRTAIREGQ